MYAERTRSDLEQASNRDRVGLGIVSNKARKTTPLLAVGPFFLIVYSAKDGFMQVRVIISELKMLVL